MGNPKERARKGLRGASSLEECTEENKFLRVLRRCGGETGGEPGLSSAATFNENSFRKRTLSQLSRAA